MGILDFFSGGNTKVSAKSTIALFEEGLVNFGHDERAYRYVFIFRFNTIAKYAKNDRDLAVVDLFKKGKIQNCTDITIANLNTGAALTGVAFEDTYFDFAAKVAEHLRISGMPEKYVSGTNADLVKHILPHMKSGFRVPSDIQEALILSSN